jgi:hypothetical protein
LGVESDSGYGPVRHGDHNAILPLGEHSYADAAAVLVSQFRHVVVHLMLDVVG